MAKKAFTVDFQSRFYDDVANAVKYYESRQAGPVSYTHLRAHETVLDLVCRLLLEKKKNKRIKKKVKKTKRLQTSRHTYTKVERIK